MASKWQSKETAPKDGSTIKVKGRMDITSKREMTYLVSWNSLYNCFATKRGDVVVISGWQKWTGKS